MEHSHRAGQDPQCEGDRLTASQVCLSSTGEEQDSQRYRAVP